MDGKEVNTGKEKKIIAKIGNEYAKRFEEIKEELRKELCKIDEEIKVTDRMVIVRLIKIATEIKQFVSEIKQIRVGEYELGADEEFYNIVKRFEDRWKIKIW